MVGWNVGQGLQAAASLKPPRVLLMDTTMIRRSESLNLNRPTTQPLYIANNVTDKIARTSLKASQKTRHATAVALSGQNMCLIRDVLAVADYQDS